MKNKLDEFLIKRYNYKFEKFKISPKAVGWDTLKNQEIRFQRSIDNLALKKKKILDIGCGLAGFANFLEKKKIKTKYNGIDINENFIDHNKKKFKHYNFISGNFIKSPISQSFDYCFLHGFFNLKLKKKLNLDLVYKVLKKSFLISKNSVIADFIIDKGNYSTKSDIIYYYSLEELFNLANKITKNNIISNYKNNIPQKECLLILKK